MLADDISENKPEDDSESRTSDVSTDWTASNHLDSMTDRTITQATIKIAGDVHDVEVVASCDGEFSSYNFNVFDKSGEAASFSSVDPVGLLRADAKKPVTVDRSERYRNQVSRSIRLSQFGKMSGTSETTANSLVLRLKFPNEDEEFVIDQENETFRSAMKPCADRVIDHEKFVAERFKANEGSYNAQLAADAQADADAEQRRRETRAKSERVDDF